MNKNYKEISYLLGCYAIIADGEINSFELYVLNNFLTLSKDDEVYKERQKIFSNDDAKIPLEELMRKLRLLHLNDEEKKEILTLLARIGYADFYMDSKESTLFHKVADMLDVDSTPIEKEIETEKNELVSASKLKWHESLWGKFENLTYNVLGKNDKRTDRILGSWGFVNILEGIGDEACIDLDRVSKIMNNINGELESCKEKICKLSVHSSYHDHSIENVKETFLSIGKLFNDIIEHSVHHNIELLDKKKRNMRFFTIAFMGRTKAGKSTLHKVVTQQDDDDIGIGKLRTTRYNRSWYWDRLRIVDTPGIGAPGGEVDTAIAKSIIDEADMICYIVTSDSIQETEFDFFETIKERNKPLYILLNYKSNLSEGIRLKRFLKNPTEWRDCTGPQSLKGHFERIKERLDGKYNMNAVKIIPLHLLAAQLYIENKDDKEKAEKLLEGSNIETFIRSVKSEIYETGCLKKSLSIIDGASHNIFEINDRIRSQYDILKKDVQLLNDTYKSLLSFLSIEAKNLHQDMIRIINAYEKDLENRAIGFSEEYYDNEKAGELWSKDIVVNDKQNQFQQRLDNRVADFKRKIKSKIEEVSADLQVNVKFMSASQISGKTIINTRLGIGVLGSILTLISPLIISQIWNPVGWVSAAGTLIIGGIISIFTSLFTSKAEKIRKAKEKMKNQLLEHIQSNIYSVKNDILNNTDKSVTDIRNKIDNVFLVFIRSAESLLDEINKLLENCNQSGDAINSLVGFRVLDFVGKNKIKDKKIKDMSNDFLRTNFPVVRDWEKQSLTYKYETSCSDRDKTKAEQATQMTINF